MIKFAGTPIVLGGQAFYEGMQCLWRKNIYEDQLWMTNGQIFTITNINALLKPKQMTIQSNDDKISYTFSPDIYSSPEYFIPGYCSTIHSAQGNEYPTVTYIIQSGDRVSREGAYTAITRASGKLIIIGDLNRLWCATSETALRRTDLVRKICELIPESQ